MTLLVNTTVLSNFSLVQRSELLRLGSPEEVGTVPQVLEEIQAGMAGGVLPLCDWSWLPILTLETPEEVRLFDQIHQRLGKGEAACLALAITRGLKFLTDDLDARRWSQRAGVPVSGTVGVLTALVHTGTLSLDKGNRLLAEMITHGYYAPIERLDLLL